jgi:hypothetical protein
MLGKPIQNGVAGQGQVVSCSPPPYPMGRYVSGVKMNLVVHVQGRDPYKLSHECTAPGEKHPRAGMMLPLLVDPDESERISIDWDAIASADEQFAQMPITPAAGPPLTPASAPTAEGDPLERMEKLVRLRDAGALTDAEFEELKAQILAG